MRDNAAVLIDVFNVIRVYVDKSELKSVALELVRVFDDHGMADSLEEDDTITGILKKAVAAHFEIDSIDEYSDDGDYDD